MENQTYDIPVPKLNPDSGNLFLNQTWKGRSGFGWYALSMFIAFIAFAVVGSFPFLILVMVGEAIHPGLLGSFQTDPTNFSALPFPYELIFTSVMMQFVVGMLGLWFVSRVVLGKPLFTLVTGYPRFRWKRFFAATGVTFLLLILLTLVSYLLDPGNFQFTVSLNKFLVFLPFALILLPLQTGFEEFFFRGLLLQGFHRILRRMPWLSWVITSVLFGSLHFFNPEVSTNGVGPAMASYIGMGLFLGFFAIIDEGLEISWGLHFANNFFSFVFVGYNGMVLESPCLMLIKKMNPWMDIVSTAILCFILYLVFCRKKGKQLKVLFTGQPGLPAEG